MSKLKPMECLCEGCYYLEYWPINAIRGISHFRGTVRVVRRGKANLSDIVSGDLYQCTDDQGHAASETARSIRTREARAMIRKLWIEPWLLSKRQAKTPYASVPKLLTPPPDWNTNPSEAPFNSSAKVPIFARDDYYAYLERTEIHIGQPEKHEFSIKFRLHEFDHKAERFDIQRSPTTLRFVGQHQKDVSKFVGQFHGKLDVDPDTLDPTNGQRFLQGVAFDEENAEVGCFTLCHVSPHVREAVLEIGRVGESSPAPLTTEMTAPASTKSLDSTVENRSWMDVYADAKWNWIIGCPEPTAVISRKSEHLPAAITDDEATLIKPNSAQPWTFAELHLGVQVFRDPTARKYPALLDHQWRYHLLCVPRIANVARGVSYDVGDSDLNTTPREGAAIAYDYTFPVIEIGTHPSYPCIAFPTGRRIFPDFEPRRFAERTDLYFRTAVHEIGHLQGLDHNQADYGFMNTTNVIAFHPLARRAARREIRRVQSEQRLLDLLPPKKSGQKKKGQGSPESQGNHRINQQFRRYVQEDLTYARNEAALSVLPNRRSTVEEFPQNVEFRFHGDDIERLQHAPDVMVRPGTHFNPRHSPFLAPAASKPAAGLDLTVAPLLDDIPIGAPVRCNLRLTNITDQSSNPSDLHVPASLSLKRGHVSGVVQDSAGNVQAFHPLLAEDDRGHDIMVLHPGESISHSISLLRGSGGALFPQAGAYRIIYSVNWDVLGDEDDLKTGGATPFGIRGQTTVQIVTPADEDVAHVNAADHLLASHETLLAFALRVSLQNETGGTAVALRKALDTRALRPHYHIVRANQYFELAMYGESSRWYQSQELKVDYFVKFSDCLRLALSSIESDSVLSISEIWRLWKIAWVAENGHLLQLQLVQLEDMTDKDPKEFLETHLEGDRDLLTIARVRDHQYLVQIADSELISIEIPAKEIDSVWEPRYVRMSEKVQIMRTVLQILSKTETPYKSDRDKLLDQSRGPNREMVWEANKALLDELKETKMKLLHICERYLKSGRLNIDNAEDADLLNLVKNIPEQELFAYNG